MDTAQSCAHWRAVWILAVGTAALTGSEILPAGLLSPIARDLSVGDAIAGQAVTIAALSAVVSSLFTSMLAGKVDRRSVLLAILGLQVVSNVIVACASDIYILMLGRILLGFGLGGFWALSTSLAITLVPEKSVPYAISIIFGGVAVATVIAPPLGSIFATVVGWRGVFLGLSLLSAFVLFGQMLWLPPMRPIKSVHPETILAAASNKTLLLGFAGVAFSFSGNLCIFTYIRPFLEYDNAFSEHAVSSAFVLFASGTTLGAISAGFILSKSIHGALALMTATVSSAGLILVTVLDSPLAAFAYMFILGLGFGIIPVGWSTWLSRVANNDPESAGALLVATIQASIASGAAIGGFAFDIQGSKGSILLGSLMMTGATAIIAVCIRRRTAAN